MMTVAEGRKLAAGLLTAVGMRSEEAGVCADAMVLADVWGIGSHGLLRLPYYLRRLQLGGYSPDAVLRTVNDTGPLVCLDGGRGLGHWQVQHAAETAVQRSGKHGVAVVAVGNSGHCGALGVYALRMAAAGRAGLVFSHGPAVMAAWGGRDAVLSSSPIAAGFPAQPPVIVDLAASAVSRGRIAQYAQRGDELPVGWAFGADGEATTDADAALGGMLAPLGGPKGYALAVLVETLTAGLVGPALSADVPDMFDRQDDSEPQQIAHLVIALDPARLDSTSGQGAGRLRHLIDRIDASGGRVPGSRRPALGDVDPALGIGIPVALEAELRELHASTWPDPPNGLDRP
jgi:(2R)-3-sulfolactate dehydrogenase (NADP+)